jgi:hypothetical protein
VIPDDGMEVTESRGELFGLFSSKMSQKFSHDKLAHHINLMIFR